MGLCVVAVSGCGNQDAAAEKAAAPVGGIAAAVGGKVEGAVEMAGGGNLVDPGNKEFAKRACDWLTAEAVSGAFGVPAGEIKQMKIAGCIYNWKQGGQIVEANLLLPMVHDSVDRARLWFANATANKTREQLHQEVDMVEEELREHESLDTDIRKKAAGSLMDAARAGTLGDVRYEDVPGVGDEARISSDDGTMRVRMGNVTFSLSAYKGAEPPPVEFTQRNLKVMQEEAIAAQNRWIQDTLAARQDAAKKLAPDVIAAIHAAGD